MPSRRRQNFSSTIAVMDKIGGWEEENWVVSRFAASMWIYTKTVKCNGQKQHAGLQVAVKWVCDALDDHVWVFELTKSCQEAKFLGALQYDTTLRTQSWSSGNCCGSSAPTDLNRRFSNNGTILEMYNEVAKLALVATSFTLPFGKMHTPRICFFVKMDTCCIVQITGDRLGRGQRDEG